MSDYTIKPAGKNLYTIRRGRSPLLFAVPLGTAVQVVVCGMVSELYWVAV